MVADDSETVRDILCFLLDSAGYETRQATDGLDALQKVLSAPPDLLLLDVDMPRMNGYQVCRVIKADKDLGSLPVVMLTSRDRKLDRMWGMSTGADAYVVKALDDDEDPFGDLGSVLENCLEGLRPRPPASEEAGQVPADEILERLNAILDSQLFRQSLRRRVSDLAQSMQNLDETVRAIADILEQAGDIAAGFIMVGREQGKPRAWSFARKGISPKALEALRSRAQDCFCRELGAFDAEQLDCRDLSSAPGGEGELSTLEPWVLKARNSTIGVALLATPKSSQVDQGVIDTLGLLLDNAALVLDNAQLFAGLEASNHELQRTLDELTSTQVKLQESEQKVQRLEILIDQSKKERKVAEIVESEYFDSLKKRVADLRKKSD
jgi:twitching motility two-component system response regulator PilH